MSKMLGKDWRNVMEHGGAIGWVGQGDAKALDLDRFDLCLRSRMALNPTILAAVRTQL
jgi:hypothetical protein